MTDKHIYSSHPIQNLQIGKFRFAKAVLRLGEADAAEFDAVLAGLPSVTAGQVRKIDMAKVEEIAQTANQEPPAAIQGAATSQSLQEASAIANAAVVDDKKNAPEIPGTGIQTPASGVAPAMTPAGQTPALNLGAQS